MHSRAYLQPATEETDSNRMHDLHRPAQLQLHTPEQETKVLQYARGLENNFRKSCVTTNSLQAQLAGTVHELRKLKRAFEKLSRDLGSAQRERDMANSRAQAFETVLSWTFTRDSASPMHRPHSWENLVRENEQNKQRIQELEYALLVQDDQMMEECHVAIPPMQYLHPPSLSTGPSISGPSAPPSPCTPPPLLDPYVDAP
ncbi:hypothetical protein NpNSSI1_00002542 [Neofusicoccum parvum]|nr:hypothetical protein NpNSSI1_00002542 [Neofusicoccum parvum]